MARLIGWVGPAMATDFLPDPYDPGAAHGTLLAAGRSAKDHERFLSHWNGGYALRGGLHLLGAVSNPPNQSLDAWNAHDGWRNGFGALVDGVTFFAETAFGDQFGYRDGKVVWLHALDARVERMAAGFTEWLECVLIEPGRYLAIDALDACVARHGRLPYGGHFAPGGPWNGVLDPAGMEVVPARDSMERKAAASMVGGRGR